MLNVKRKMSHYKNAYKPSSFLRLDRDVLCYAGRGISKRLYTSSLCARLVLRFLVVLILIKKLSYNLMCFIYIY